MMLEKHGTSSLNQKTKEKNIKARSGVGEPFRKINVGVKHFWGGGMSTELQAFEEWAHFTTNYLLHNTFILKKRASIYKL